MNKKNNASIAPQPLCVSSSPGPVAVALRRRLLREERAGGAGGPLVGRAGLPRPRHPPKTSASFQRAAGAPAPPPSSPLSRSSILLSLSLSYTAPHAPEFGVHRLHPGRRHGRRAGEWRGGVEEGEKTKDKRSAHSPSPGARSRPLSAPPLPSTSVVTPTDLHFSLSLSLIPFSQAVDYAINSAWKSNNKGKLYEDCVAAGTIGGATGEEE